MRSSLKFPVTAVILAAGASSRFQGTNKLLQPFGGNTVVGTVMAHVAQSKAHRSIVVGDGNVELEAAAASHGFQYITPDRTESAGMAASLRAGVKLIDDSVCGAIIVLGDMPRVTGSLINELIDLFEVYQGQRIIFPVGLHGQQGHPVIWPKSLFPELQCLQGDSGAKSLLQKYGSMTVTKSNSAPGAFQDIDTVEDYETMRLDVSELE